MVYNCLWLTVSMDKLPKDKRLATRRSSYFRRGLVALCFAAALCLAAAAAMSAPPLTANAGGDPADLAAGKAVYEQRCAVCHFADSTAKKVGPGLKDMYPRGKFADGRKVDDPAVIGWIEKGGKDMPGYRDVLKTEQVRDLVAYLQSL